MIVDQQHWQDVKRYYENTLIKLSETGDKVYHVTKVDALYMYLEDDKGEPTYVDLKNGYNLDFSLPNKAVFLYNNTLVYLCRHPDKQFKKGLSSSNTLLSYMSDTGGWVDTHDISKSIFNAYCTKHQFFPLETITQDVFKAYNAVPINTRASLHKSGKLFLDKLQIGTINFKTKLLSCHSAFQGMFEHKGYKVEYYG